MSSFQQTFFRPQSTLLFLTGRRSVDANYTSTSKQSVTRFATIAVDTRSATLSSSNCTLSVVHAPAFTVRSLAAQYETRGDCACTSQHTSG